VTISILCAAFLVSSLGASGENGRRRAREFVCLTNVRQLAQGWLLFAEEHDGELVGGQAMGSPMQWVGWPAWTGATVEQKLDVIRKGRLFPYVGDVHIYHCPAAEPRGEPNLSDPRSFSIAGGANGETWNEYQKATRYAELENPLPALCLCGGRRHEGCPLRLLADESEVEDLGRSGRDVA
jgi:hypothetical protein